jgi:hypothetical protein
VPSQASGFGSSFEQDITKETATNRDKDNKLSGFFIRV